MIPKTRPNGLVFYPTYSYMTTVVYIFQKRKKVLDKSEYRAIISVFGSRRRYSSVGRATDL